MGSEKYYPKSGYISAEKLEIKAPFDVPKSNFMVIDLKNENIRLNKKVKYPDELGI